MKVLYEYPFTKLGLPPDETIVWSAMDRTFHRGGDYALLVTNRALYLYSPFWMWFSRWRRLEFSEIEEVAFRDSRWRPQLQIRLTNGRATLSTPPGRKDEMDYDRSNLAQAANVVARQMQQTLS
ncbi:hypothetical protein [Arenimonas oryziterrae]|uniref:YokE-like PH domain-containing protein n=1 Tax=Arenimonas oryziterrae DSM 21050 = YC6267 TaxID=1121015 RepID=A0A091BF81_9GAMM|nr:hypothetical protein [Arenimonas oryziterrae]KFN43025.1 hypothetical protein N789_10715 [Arenimonas oryziterrae DSM 21050 = YC6267]